MTFFRLLRAGMHSMLLFALPWIIGALVGVVFDIGEVKETQSDFARWFMLIVMPLMVLQIIGIGVKIGRERRSMAQRGERGFSAFVVALDKHVRVLTSRGVSLVVGSVVMLFCALAVKWGQFAVVAVAGLGLLYIFSTAATFASAFSIRAFDDRVRRGRGSIDREMSPTVLDAGDPVEERFILARVPVPPGFRLHLHEALPERLGGETRFAVDRSVSGSQATLSAPLPRTARGVYKLGPAQIWYEDILGVTRVAVATHACTSMRVLPRLRSVVFQKKPESHAKAEGPLSLMARIATEDFFKTRAYTRGDDARRVHWKLSINTGALHVRVPESIPFAPRKIRLVLDTYLPLHLRMSAPLLADALDLLVESWIGLAHSLVQRGEKVTLALCLRNDQGVVAVRELFCRRGEERVWRSLGADAVWQSDASAGALLGPNGRADEGAVIVSAGLSPMPNMLGPASSIVTIATQSMMPITGKDPRRPLDRLFRYPYPAGADDNAFDWRSILKYKTNTAAAFRDVGHAARSGIEAARATGARVMVMDRKGPHLELAPL